MLWVMSIGFSETVNWQVAITGHCYFDDPIPVYGDLD